MAEPWIGPKFGQPTFNCNISSDSTHRTPRSASTHSQGSCEWFKHNCEVLWVKLEQILQLKVGCPNFDPVRDSAIYPIYLYYDLNHILVLCHSAVAYLEVRQGKDKPGSWLEKPGWTGRDLPLRAPVIPSPGWDWGGDVIYNENGPFLLLFFCFSATAMVV